MQPVLSIGGPPDLRLVLSKEVGGKPMQKCEQINDLGVTVNTAITPSTNVLTAANKARGMLYFTEKFICMPDDLRVSNTPPPICHPSKLSLPQ